MRSLHDFFFNDTATTEIYTLSLHDALPIFRRPPAACSRQFCLLSAGVPDSGRRLPPCAQQAECRQTGCTSRVQPVGGSSRSEEHTSELQSRQYLVCRLLLEKKTDLHSRHYI